MTQQCCDGSWQPLTAFEKQSLEKPPPKQSANPVFCQSFHDKMFCFRIDLSRFVTRWLGQDPPFFGALFFEASLLLPARRFCDFLTAKAAAAWLCIDRPINYHCLNSLIPVGWHANPCRRSTIFPRERCYRNMSIQLLLCIFFVRLFRQSPESNTASSHDFTSWSIIRLQGLTPHHGHGTSPWQLLAVTPTCGSYTRRDIYRGVDVETH